VFPCFFYDFWFSVLQLCIHRQVYIASNEKPETALAYAW
jgi:hypothetical protein